MGRGIRTAGSRGTLAADDGTPMAYDERTGRQDRGMTMGRRAPRGTRRRRASGAALLILVAGAAPVRADEPPSPVTIRTPRPGDGLGDQVSAAGSCGAPGQIVRLKLLDGDGRRIASASTPCLKGTGAGRYRARLGPVPLPATVMGRVQASIEGAPSGTAGAAVPVVFLGPLRALTR
jgi:hypothetical protein